MGQHVDRVADHDDDSARVLGDDVVQNALHNGRVALQQVETRLARALRGLEDWEAAALGFAWIPVFMSPTNYYYSFVVAGALLAKRRPRIGAWLLAASLAWTAFGLVFYLTEGAFMAASAAARARSRCSRPSATCRTNSMPRRVPRRWMTSSAFHRTSASSCSSHSRSRGSSERQFYSTRRDDTVGTGATRSCSATSCATCASSNRTRRTTT